MDGREALIRAEIQKPDYVRRRLRELGFWFVDIPRTSSTSIRQALYEKHGKLFGRPSSGSGLAPGLIPPHAPANRIRSQLGSELWDSLYTFTIVRNPFQRVLSLYQFLRSNGQLRHLTFADYVRRIARPDGFDFHGHYLSSWGYISGTGNQPLVSEVFRFEDRAAAIARIAEKTLCPALIADQRHTYVTGASTGYTDHYTSESRQIVEDLFADDLERFDYRFEPG